MKYCPEKKNPGIFESGIGLRSGKYTYGRLDSAAGSVILFSMQFSMVK
jgi:hypothetical protein